MATHSSVLAWRIPGTGEPGGLPSMGSHRVRHEWSDLAAAAVFSCLVTSSSLQPHGWRPSRIHGDSAGKNTGVGCQALLQSLFPTQGSNPGLLHCRRFFTNWATREAQLHVTWDHMNWLTFRSSWNTKWQFHMFWANNRHHVKCRARWSTSWNPDTRRNINKLRYADDTTLMAESKEELKDFLMKVKEESGKVGFKTQHSKN